MSRFYVGQRVRIVRVRQPSMAQVGWEAVVYELGVSHLGEAGLIEVTAQGHHWAFRPSELEPILYDGNQLVSWQECLWQPEGQPA